MANSRKALEALLAGLGESSQFVTSGSLPPALPGLEVAGIGSIGSPVSAADAQRLISSATQAPYGRGEKTVTDTTVRRVWQIEPSQFELQNSEWDAHIAGIVDAVRRDFGIASKVKAELYKLLIYEKGSFFAPHRDTEKTSNMFATLVVCLPSRHEGGTLVVRHDGQTKRIDFGGKGGGFKTQYVAFYADCEHEIEPVTAGYRVCLVYNLATTGKRQPSAPENAAAVAQACDLLRALFADTSAKLNKIAIPFTHQYTEAGLDPAQLKGSDRARADVLSRAAETLGYACYLALLTHWQSGTPDYSTMDYDPYDRRRSYGWSDYDDDEDDDDDDNADDSQVEMEEVVEEEISLDHWLDPQGKKQDFGEIHLEDTEILTLGSRKGWSLRQEIQEATGNAGASMERWYRQGVIVIWPRDRTFGILAREGQAAALAELEKLTSRSKRADDRAACRTFAGEIVDHWEPRIGAPQGEKAYSVRMLEVLERLDAVDLAQRFIRDVLPRDFDGSEGKLLLRLAGRMGWTALGTAVCKLIDQQKPEDYRARLQPIIALCRPLCCDTPQPTDDRRKACLELAQALTGAIERWDCRKAMAYVGEESRRGVVDGAIHIFASIPANKQLDWFLGHALDDKRNYDLHKVLIPDVKAVYKWLPEVAGAREPAERLLAHCKSELEAATVRPIEAPNDWSRDAELDCNCEDCQALSRFLRDPSARVGRFPVRKDRRQHLHCQIDVHRCDCTHVTERKGSPQTLVCTKTQASYERRLQQYKIDRQLLGELSSLKSGEAKPPKRRIAKSRSVKR